MGSFPDVGMRRGSSYLHPLSRFGVPVVYVGTETWEGVVGRREGGEAWSKQLDLCCAHPTLPLAVPQSRAATPLDTRRPWSFSYSTGWGQTCGLRGWAGTPQLLACAPSARATQAECPQLGEAGPTCSATLPGLSGAHSPQLTLGPGLRAVWIL